MSKKVSYNINLNHLRKKLMTELDVALKLIFLMGESVLNQQDKSSLDFDSVSEGYCLGQSNLKFNLKDVPEEKTFHLDFCGDKIFEMSVNGLDVPLEQIEWENNQISLSNLRIGRLGT